MKSLLKILLPVITLTLIFFSCQTPPDDFQIIKERVVGELMLGNVDDSRVETILSRMNEDGSFKDINYEDLSRTAGFPHRHHTSDLVYLARAYKTKASAHHRSAAVKDAIIKGLTYWVEHDYVGDNWHDNQITTPTNLGNLILIAGDELPADLVEKAQPMIGRAHMNASGARPSGDRIVIAGILAKNLLFTGQKEEFDKIIRLIESEVKFSTGERGMQHDYSFHHRVDRVNNTTSYGYGKYANAFGEWSYYVSGTRYQFSVEKINHLVDYYLDGICKQLVYGIYEDVSVKNRSITSKSNFEPRGVTEIERLLHSTDYRRAELEEIIRLRKGESKPSLSFSKFFWQTEHFVFQRPDFYTTVRMYSVRNRNMEEPYNGPGKPTHHRADGTNYLMLNGDEYHNIWPVYDWQKISGTTILQKPQWHPIEMIQVDGLTEFVGAVTDDLYGAVAFDFISAHDKVEARKSWFFFDEEYVCLGTGIRSKSPLPVATTVNQALMRSDVAVMQDGIVQTLPKGNHELRNVKWIYHDRVGYILPEPSGINLSNQPEQGRWSDITDQKNISDELITEDVFMLWFDHGKSPANASYRYIVVPAVTEEELKNTAGDNRGIEILAQDQQIHAVKNNKLGICQIAFYEAGEVEIQAGAKVKMDSPGMAMLRMQGDKITSLTLSDPSRKLSSITITLPGIYAASGEAFTSSPDTSRNTTTFTARLPQDVNAGKSLIIQL